MITNCVGLVSKWEIIISSIFSIPKMTISTSGNLGWKNQKHGKLSFLYKMYIFFKFILYIYPSIALITTIRPTLYSCFSNLVDRYIPLLGSQELSEPASLSFISKTIHLKAFIFWYPIQYQLWVMKNIFSTPGVLIPPRIFLPFL